VERRTSEMGFNRLPVTTLASATTIANEWRAVAVVWHVVVTVIVTAVFCGWRPSNRATACVLSAPFLSVSVAAWAWSNP